MIKQRGKSWQADFTVGDQRFRKDFPSAHAAEVFEAETRANLLRAIASPQGTTAPVGGWTVQRAYRRTLAVRWKGTKAELTQTHNARCAVDFFGPDTLCSDVTTSRVTDFALALEAKGNSRGTVNRKLAALSTMLRLAREEGGTAVLPTIRRKREGIGRTAFITPEDEAQIVAHLKAWSQEAFADLVVLLADTGLRLGEALRLTQQDVHRERGERPMLSVWENKAELPRSVPLTARADAAFARSVPFDLKPHQIRAVWDRLRVVMKREEDPFFVVHILRHTCASRLVQRGVAIQVVQQWLGHKTISQTLRYAHLAPKNLRDAGAVLEQAA